MKSAVEEIDDPAEDDGEEDHRQKFPGRPSGVDVDETVLCQHVKGRGDQSGISAFADVFGAEVDGQTGRDIDQDEEELVRGHHAKAENAKQGGDIEKEIGVKESRPVPVAAQGGLVDVDGKLVMEKAVFDGLDAGQVKGLVVAVEQVGLQNRVERKGNHCGQSKENKQPGRSDGSQKAVLFHSRTPLMHLAGMSI